VLPGRRAGEPVGEGPLLADDCTCSCCSVGRARSSPGLRPRPRRPGRSRPCQDEQAYTITAVAVTGLLDPGGLP